MKLIVSYKDSISGNKRLFPRDIRNYLGSITKDMPILNEIVMWHKHQQPKIIYSMPNRKGFGIYTFLPDDEMKKHFKCLQEAIINNPKLKIKDLELEVKDVEISNHQYTDFKDGMYEKTFTSPMILGSSSGEYQRAKALSKDNKIDEIELKKFITDTIVESLRFQNKDWFGIENFEIEDLMLIYKDVEYFVIKYNKDQWYPAVRATVISNKKLPQFVGYKCGMGYGELRDTKRGLK